MTTVTIHFGHGAMAGHPHTLPAGTEVVADLPAGCVMRAGNTMQSLAIVSSPYTLPADGIVRVDCDTYTAPVTATLEIG